MGAYYDKERLLDEADSELIVDYLNIDTHRSGKNVFILCPGHKKVLGKEDTNFGNCVLTPKGYHCFGCNKKVRIDNMVMELENVDYQEALGIIGDALGGRENYNISGEVSYEKKERIKILPNKDLELIGLKDNISFDMLCFPDASKKYISECKLEPKPDVNDVYADYYIASKHKTISIKSLLTNSPKVYYSIVKKYAKQAMEKYQRCIDELCDYKNEKSKLLLNLEKSNKLNNEVLYDYKVIYTQMYERCKEIYDSIDKEKCLEEDIKMFEPKREIPKFDLFD